MNKESTQLKPACQLCGCDKRCDLQRGVFVRPLVAELIRKEFGRWEEDGWICTQDMQRYRHKYVQHPLEEEKGEISSLGLEVLESMRAQEVLSKNPDAEHVAGLTFGQRMADRFYGVAGSWGFILSIIMMSRAARRTATGCMPSGTTR